MHELESLARSLRDAGAVLLPADPAAQIPFSGDGLGYLELLLSTPAARGLIETGRIKALGVTGTRRLRLFPGVPTLAEQGYAAPLYRMTAGWIGIMGPAGVPDAIVQRLGAEYVGAIQTPEVRDRLLELGLEPIGADAPTFAATYARERPIWRDLLVRAGVEVRAP